jgi:hypothetical protein
MIRNRYGKNVVVSGVRGSVSNDLVEAAGGCFEPLEFPPVADVDRREAFIRFVDRLERSKPFITFKYVAAAMTTSSEFPGLADEEAREFVAQAIQEGTLIKQQRPDGYRVLHLNRDLEDITVVLSREPVAEAGPYPEEEDAGLEEEEAYRAEEPEEPVYEEDAEPASVPHRETDSGSWNL